MFWETAEEAIANCQQALQLDPHYEEARNNLKELEGELDPALDMTTGMHHLDRQSNTYMPANWRKLSRTVRWQFKPRPDLTLVYNYRGMIWKNSKSMKKQSLRTNAPIELDPVVLCRP